MKSIVFVFLPCTFVSVAQSMAAQEQRCRIADVAQAIGDVIENWKFGYNAGNPEQVAALYAPDATYLTQHFVTGIVHGRPAIRAYVKKGTDAQYRIEAISLLASDCSSNFAYAVTRYESINAGTKAFGVNLVVLQKLNGKWLIVAHESAVPDPANAIRTLESVDAK